MALTTTYVSSRISVQKASILASPLGPSNKHSTSASISRISFLMASMRFCFLLSMVSNSLSSHSTFQVVTFSVSPMCIIVYYFLTKHLLPHHQLHCFGESINIVKKIIRLTAAFITKWLTFHSPCFLDPSPCFWPKHSYLILRPTGLVYHETTVRT